MPAFAPAALATAVALSALGAVALCDASAPRRDKVRDEGRDEEGGVIASRRADGAQRVTGLVLRVRPGALTTWVPTASPPAVVVSPAPASPPAPVPPPIATTPRAAPQETAAPPAGPARRQSLDLRSKLREDWRDIRRGVDSAGDDFRRAIDSVKRGLE
jgi:hypothetical protein